jgi:hypothetical protein
VNQTNSNRDCRDSEPRASTLPAQAVGQGGTGSSVERLNQLREAVVAGLDALDRDEPGAAERLSGARSALRSYEAQLMCEAFS